MAAHDLAVRGQARVLHRHACVARPSQGLSNEREPVAEAGADQYLFGCRDDTSGSGQVARQLLRQFGTPAPIAVVEDVVRRDVEHEADGS